MNDGKLITAGQRPAVRLERQLIDPPPIVWQALTDRQRLIAWFPCDVAVEGGEWRVGSLIKFTFAPEVMDLTLTGQVLIVDPPNVLSFTWGEETLRFELSPVDGGTRLILIDELQADLAARSAAGWELCLDRLAGFTPAHTSWHIVFEGYVTEFEGTLGPQQGPPPEYKGELS